jgi:hypothetical protein
VALCAFAAPVTLTGSKATAANKGAFESIRARDMSVLSSEG